MLNKFDRQVNFFCKKRFVLLLQEKCHINKNYGRWRGALCCDEGKNRKNNMQIYIFLIFFFFFCKRRKIMDFLICGIILWKLCQIAWRFISINCAQILHTVSIHNAEMNIVFTYLYLYQKISTSRLIQATPIDIFVHFKKPKTSR